MWIPALYSLLTIQSPWWLVQQDRIDDARKVLLALHSGSDPRFNVNDRIAMMVHTNVQEKAVDAGTSYKDCFTGVDLRRTEIACCVWMIQVGCGIWFGGNVSILPCA
jgi:MFS transporter, SP family, general alpha glucoside:H+ symporter